MRRIAAVVLAAAAAAPAQGLPRERVFGLARTAEGAPWAGATVELWWRPVPADETVGGGDTVVVQADEQGRFRAAILPGRGYTAFAWRPESDGSHRVSELVTGIVPRDALLLEQRPEPRESTAVRVGRHESVREPVSVVVRPWHPAGIERPVPLDEARTGRIPPLPPGPATLEVRDASGLVVLEDARDWAAREPKIGPVGVEQLALPALPRGRILARDAVTGEALPAARVVATRGARALLVGTLGADGCGELPMPRNDSWFVYADGHAPAPLQRGAEPPPAAGAAPWPELREGFVADWHAQAAVGARCAGRITIDGEPAGEAAWLVIHEVAMHQLRHNVRALATARRTFRLAADGRFGPIALLDGYPPIFELVLGEPVLARLPEAWRRAQPIVVLGGRALDGDFELLDCVAVQLELVAPDGTPALGATVRLEPELPAGHRLYPAAAVVADRSGKACVLLPPDSGFVVTITSRDGPRGPVTELVSLRSGRPERLAALQPLRIRFREPMSLEGQVLGPDGRPRGGLQLKLGARPGREQNGTADRTLDAAVDWSFVDLAKRLRLSRLPSFAATTDAEGRFRFTLPPAVGDFLLTGPRVSQQVRIDDPRHPEPIEVRFR